MCELTEEEKADRIADGIVAMNEIFQDESLEYTLKKWVEIRDKIDIKYPNKPEIAKAELIRKIMKRLKITNISGRIR